MAVTTPLRRRLRPPFPYGAPTVPRGVERPPERRRTGADYDTAWARREPARYARFFLVEGPMRLAVRAVASPTRTGTDRLTGLTGTAIFAANHHSHVDTPLLLTSIPPPWRHRLVVAAAADYFFPNRVTSAVSALAMGAFPIERARVSRRSADQAAALLAEGWSLLIYPEGGRSPDGWGQGHRGGAAYLSIRAGAPVVPVHLEGTGRILGRGDRRLRPGTSRVTFGRPLWPAPDEDARRFAPRIEAAVASLADEVTTDWWSARRRAAAGRSPSLTGPATTSWRRAWALGDRRGGWRRSRARWPDL
jgi:1-acyl-sn-glycerol-3-phosphate acyltransferase